jgi:hypothetical protein
MVFLVTMVSHSTSTASSPIKETKTSNLQVTPSRYLNSYPFQGDDDVFVFINDKLAIDLGGVHPAQTASIDLTYPSSGCPANVPAGPCSLSGWKSSTPCACILGLKPGNTYSFDLFYNERHTTESDLAFSTTIIIQCPAYDWCGVCQGDGQSCWYDNR